MKNNTNFKKDFSKEFKSNMQKFGVWLRRIYVWSFNAYAWFWLYRLIFVKASTDWEEYFLWFLTTAGMYFFVLDSKDLFFSENRLFKNKNSTAQ